jgi:hypothetical protein
VTAPLDDAALVGIRAVAQAAQPKRSREEWLPFDSAAWSQYPNGAFREHARSFCLALAAEVERLRALLAPPVGLPDVAKIAREQNPPAGRFATPEERAERQASAAAAEACGQEVERQHAPIHAAEREAREKAEQDAAEMRVDYAREREKRLVAERETERLHGVVERALAHLVTWEAQPRGTIGETDAAVAALSLLTSALDGAAKPAEPPAVEEMATWEQRQRVIEAFYKAGLAQLDAAAVARGFAAPFLPSKVPVVAAGFRQKAAGIVVGMPDETIRKLCEATDEVLIGAFGSIAQETLAKTLD